MHCHIPKMSLHLRLVSRRTSETKQSKKGKKESEEGRKGGREGRRGGGEGEEREDANQLTKQNISPLTFENPILGPFRHA